MADYAFIGVGTLTGSWNAATNSGSLSSGDHLFRSGSAPADAGDNIFAHSASAPRGTGGYHNSTNLTASVGDYWEVTTDGTFTLDENRSFTTLDWVIWDGEKWERISNSDKIGSVMVGNTNNVLEVVTNDLGIEGGLDVNTNDGNNDFTVSAEGVEKALWVDASANCVVMGTGSTKVGIGTATPGDHPDEKNDLVVGSNSAHHGMTIASGPTHMSTLRFTYSTSANDGEGWIDYSNNTKKMRLGTNGLNTRMTIDSSGKVGIGDASPAHLLTVAGDISGSGKIFNVGGVQTQGDLGVTGSAQISGSLTIGASAVGEERNPTHPLTVRGDMSGSGKMFIVGGIETQGDLGVTGSATVRGDLVFGNNGNRSITVETTAEGTAGKDLTIQAGSTTNGSSNTDGGDLILKAGQADGTGNSSILFHTQVNDGSGDVSERMRIHTNGTIGIGTNNPTANMHIKQGSSGGLTLLTLQNEDTDKIALYIDADNIDADVIDIAADAVQDARVIDISADALTTGAALYIDDNSSSPSTRSTVKIIQNNAAATGATALTLQSNGGNIGMTLDKNASGDAAQDAIGLKLDFDRTVASSGTAAHNDIGIDLDVNSRSLGTSTVKGMDIDVVGHTDGTHTAYGIDLDVDSADTNIGIQINTAGTHLKLIANADTDDYATIAVADTGDLTIATVGDGTTDSDITLFADGDIILKPAGGDVLPDGDNTRNLGASGVRWANIYTADLHLKNERGDWTIIEEENDLTIRNNKTNKMYRFKLEEIED